MNKHIKKYLLASRIVYNFLLVLVLLLAIPVNFSQPMTGFYIRDYSSDVGGEGYYYHAFISDLGRILDVSKVYGGEVWYMPSGRCNGKYYPSYVVVRFDRPVGSSLGLVPGVPDVECKKPFIHYRLVR